MRLGTQMREPLAVIEAVAAHIQGMRAQPEPVRHPLLGEIEQRLADTARAQRLVDKKLPQNAFGGNEREQAGNLPVMLCCENRPTAGGGFAR